MEPHELAFYSKALEHAEDNPEEQRTIVDATMNALFEKSTTRCFRKRQS